LGLITELISKLNIMAKKIICTCGSKIDATYYLIHQRSKKHKRHEGATNVVIIRQGSFFVSFN